MKEEIILKHSLRFNKGKIETSFHIETSETSKKLTLETIILFGNTKELLKMSKERTGFYLSDSYCGISYKEDLSESEIKELDIDLKKDELLLEYENSFEKHFIIKEVDYLNILNKYILEKKKSKQKVKEFEQLDLEPLFGELHFINNNEKNEKFWISDKYEFNCYKCKEKIITTNETKHYSTIVDFLKIEEIKKINGLGHTYEFINCKKCNHNYYVSYGFSEIQRGRDIKLLHNIVSINNKNYLQQWL